MHVCAVQSAADNKPRMENLIFILISCFQIIKQVDLCLERLPRRFKRMEKRKYTCDLAAHIGKDGNTIRRVMAETKCNILSISIHR